MSTGTRKKKLDYKSMLQNDVDNEFIQSWRNGKTEKAPKENSSTFLNKKRLLSTSNKTKIAKEKEMKLQKLKTQEKNNKITKQEYDSILAEYADEMKALGIDPPSENENTSSLIADLNSLYYNLFYYTKFENSKPYKMIDYIINNDNLLINRPIDKERFEEIKKSVFSKSKLNKDDNLNVVFKALYEYFKTDFSNSFICKLFEKINDKLQNYGNGNRNDETMSLSQEKKDKFTYSNFLTEKLRQTNNYSLISYTNDKDFVKSLIYLNNKSNRHLNKKNKLDKKLIEALKLNSQTINRLSQLPLSNEEMKCAKNILNNKKLNKFIQKRFGWVINCIDEMKDSNMDEKQFVKFIDAIFKSKEDECEKTSSKLIGDTKTLWICIKFVFYLHMLSQKDNVVYYTDNNFWKEIMTYLNSKKAIMNSQKFKFKSPDKSKLKKRDNKKGNKSDCDVFQVNSEKKDLKEGLIKEFDSLINSIPIEKVDKDIEMETVKTSVNPMEDIMQIVLSRYDKGEDVFLFTREDKKGKKKDNKTPEKEKEKEKEREQEQNQENKDLENGSKMHSLNNIEEKKEKEQKESEMVIIKDIPIEKEEKVRRKRNSNKNNDSNSAIKDSNVKTKKPRGRKKKNEEINSNNADTNNNNNEVLSDIENKEEKRIILLKKHKNDIKENEDKSNETITSKTITDNGVNESNSIDNMRKTEMNRIEESISTKIRIENPINYFKEGRFGILTSKGVDNDATKEKEVILNLTPIKQEEPIKPKKSKGRPRKNKICIPINNDIKHLN